MNPVNPSNKIYKLWILIDETWLQFALQEAGDADLAEEIVTRKLDLLINRLGRTETDFKIIRVEPFSY